MMSEHLVRLDIPRDVEEHLALGDWMRHGGVVRDSDSRRIVRHLLESHESRGGDSPVRAVAVLAKDHAVMAAAMIASFVVYKFVTWREERLLDRPLREFLENLDRFMEAAEHGGRTMQMADELISSLAGLEKMAATRTPGCSSTPELDATSQLLPAHTQRMLEANVAVQDDPLIWRRSLLTAAGSIWSVSERSFSSLGDEPSTVALLSVA